ncbi:unnamed protein product [Hermetia illucens]|uniref:Uncharacterized protein n=1 Tax=Hermetia illucens TaxID=343691 RepID=A0A7R8YY14_HERIL|nr:UPF0472 protein C16orf72 homolog [Hermetia illucens]CAD7090008.1 unnamed protein product [Hermetia illucens]
MQSDEESCFEEKCLEAINSQQDLEIEFVAQRDTAARNIWSAFQDSATSIAQLYRERCAYNESDTAALWLPFQTAAGTVTTLYKESCEGIKKTSDVAVQYGYQRRTREIADWARSKRRRYIRREDLLAYLAGKPPPPLHVTRVSQLRLSPKPESPLNSSNQFLVGPNQMPAEPTDLHTFKEALVRRPRGPELYAFVASEIARNCKRPASPLDVNMDVQNLSNKRQRYM